jgi:2,3-diketo-5-methylthio-1-phosphopentane phosphatase
MGKYRLALLCDFDGTVTKSDVGFRVYTRFGDERWEEINKRWRRGEISSKECLIGEYSLIDASEDEVREYVMGMEIDPGFADLVNTCKENGIPIAVVSDGFDFYIHAILEKYGFSNVDAFCNRMWFNGRKVELAFPFYDQGCGKCGNCKTLHVKKLRDENRKVIYIGDGLSDKFASRASDVIFAKDELMEYLESNRVEFNRFSNLSDVNNWLVDLLAGNAEIPKSQPAYCETQKKIKKLRMKKIKKDMGDGRYIIYYEWTGK